MTIIRDEKYEQLRFGIGEVGGERQAGVATAMFDKIPVGALVTARVDLPTELNTNLLATLAPGAILPSLPAQGYVFEHAPEPGPFQAGFVPGLRGRNRVLVSNGAGLLTPVQSEPAWAAFSPVQSGALVQKGRKVHFIQMAGGTPGGGGDMNLKDTARHLMRLRWTATVRAAQALAAATGLAQKYTSIQLLSAGALPVTRIAPGSLVINFTAAAAPAKLRDDGKGRIVGFGNVVGTNQTAGDGVIDYLNGIISFSFPAGCADVAAVTADFEHTCAYQPLDVYAEWDAQVQ